MELPIKVPIIHHGKNSLEQLKNFKGTKILFVTDKFTRSLVEEKLNDLLEGRETAYFDEVEPNPTDTIMYKAGDLAKSFKPDLIVGIGGGSVLDTAKAAYFLYGEPTIKLHEINYFVEYNLIDKSRLVLIPTTSGTGSESSSGIVFTNKETGKKINTISSFLIPWAVIIDPALAMTMPKQLTISSGVDALAQAIESSSSILITDFLLALNLYGIKNLFKYLPSAAGEGADDIEVRQKVHHAASMIGVAMGTTSLGIGHACGHAIGSVFNLPHGMSVGLMLPYNIAYNKRKCSNLYEEILETINVDYTEDPADALASQMNDFLKKLGVPTSGKELGVTREDWDKNLDALVELASTDTTLLTNPRAAQQDKLKKIFDYVYEGKTIDF